MEIQGYQQRNRRQRRFSQLSCIQGSLFLVPCCQIRLISVLNNLLNHQNTKLNAETTNQAWNRHIFKVLGRLYNLIFCKNKNIIKIFFISFPGGICGGFTYHIFSYIEYLYYFKIVSLLAGLHWKTIKWANFISNSP